MFFMVYFFFNPISSNIYYDEIAPNIHVDITESKFIILLNLIKVVFVQYKSLLILASLVIQ